MSVRTARMKERVDIDSLQAGFLNDMEGFGAGTAEIPDLVTFFESPEWANFPLRPRQRILAKVLNNAIAQVSRRPLKALEWEVIRLDAMHFWRVHEGEFGVKPDMSTMSHCVEYHEDGSVWYDEAADYEYLISRVNPYANMVVRITGDPTTPLIVILILGRGGTKTTMAGHVSAWMSLIVLSQDDPHGFYGLLARKELKIMNVATAEKQAKEFFDAYKVCVETVPWFKGRYDPDPPLENSVEFGRIPGTTVPILVALLFASNSRSTRGGDTVVYVHDEIAHSERANEEKEGSRSDRKLWRANFAAVKTRGKGKGLAMVLSSPAEADGVLYELNQQAEKGLIENVVMAQIATWEMIPGQTKANYSPEYIDDEDGAEMEYGAQFYTGQSNLIPRARERMDDAVALGAKLGLVRRRRAYFEDERLKVNGQYQTETAPRYDYVGHLDTSKGGNRLAFALVHMEGPFTVLDYFKVWEILPHYTKELEPFLVWINERFGLRQLTFDQFNSLQLTQNLTDKGILVEERHFDAAYNDAIARNLMQILSSAGVTLAIYPTAFHGPMPKKGSGWEKGEDEEQISLYLLREEVWAAKKVVKAAARSGDKRYLIAGVAPTTGTITTDDGLDALAAAAYEARQLVMKSGKLEWLDPNAAKAWAEEQNRALRLEAEGAQEDGLPSRCLHCGHDFKDNSGLPLVPCPRCGQYTQIRMR